MVKIEIKYPAMHGEDKKMTITPVTYPSVSADSLSKPPAVTTDEAQKLEQRETGEAQKPQSSGIPDHKRFDTYEKGDGKMSASESGIYHPSEEEPKITQCTTNTDKVDAEIKKLKEEKSKFFNSSGKLMETLRDRQS
ncbi:hypothetical protein [Enterocloster bolteae]|uniref:hypothetical protein n=1 Tax=Enterocloster bolteae TaxID=208479 RepID=UPI001FACCADB|nr:hypothetical protein [Enterocloster bolteae]